MGVGGRGLTSDTLDSILGRWEERVYVCEGGCGLTWVMLESFLGRCEGRVTCGTPPTMFTEYVDSTLKIYKTLT